MVICMFKATEYMTSDELVSLSIPGICFLNQKFQHFHQGPHKFFRVPTGTFYQKIWLSWRITSPRGLLQRHVIMQSELLPTQLRPWLQYCVLLPLNLFRTLYSCITYQTFYILLRYTSQFLNIFVYTAQIYLYIHTNIPQTPCVRRQRGTGPLWHTEK